MNSDKMEQHLSKVLALQDKGQTTYGAKIDKYLADHKLIAMRKSWRNLSASDVQVFEYNCENYLNFYRLKNKPTELKFTVGRVLFDSSDIEYNYDIVSEKDLEEFRKVTWPAFLEANKKKLDGREIQEKLDKLHKKEDAIRQEIRLLERQLRTC